MAFISQICGPVEIRWCAADDLCALLEPRLVIETFAHHMQRSGHHDYTTSDPYHRVGLLRIIRYNIQERGLTDTNPLERQPLIMMQDKLVPVSHWSAQ